MRPPLPPEHAYAYSSLKAGSKSFSLAARLFSPRLRLAAARIYAWCRFCDDQIDSTESLDRGQREEVLDSLRARTRSAFRERPAGPDPVFAAFHGVAREHRIPEAYALDLLEGMAMDVRGQTYDSLDDLRLYCYRVAGTVGLMMSHAMGVTDRAALAHACDLGIAMQLTNISRDVLEDARMGRVYLPLLWLRAEGFELDRLPARLLEPEARARIARVAARLVAEAEPHYRSGRAGLRHLGLQAAFAVASALFIYRAIGLRVAKRGPEAWDTRTVVPLPVKLLCILRAAGAVLATVPGRILRPKPFVTLAGDWRYPSP